MTEPPDSCSCRDITADLDWAGSVVGSPVVGHTHLEGGVASTVIRCVFAHREQPLVLRVIDDGELLRREPDIIDREAEALQILSPAAVTAPNLVGARYSPDRGRLLMSWIDGRIIIDRKELGGRLGALAAVAAVIASTPLPADHRLAPWRSWARPNLEPPGWGDAGLWREAIAWHRKRSAPTLDDGQTVLLHRDLHPLNVLWADQAAVVDWVNACVGHPHAELGHCRWNLAVTAGPDAPDRFLNHYLGLTADRGYGPYARWWDIDSLLDKLPGPVNSAAWHAVGRRDLTDSAVAATTDTFLRSALRG